MTTDSVRHRLDHIPIECLRSGKYDVVEFHKNHQIVQTAVGIELAATITLAKALPLGLRGDEHSALRAALARKLAAGKGRFLEALPALIEEHFSRLNRVGRHDLLRSVCKPFVNDCMELLSGANLDSELYDGLSDIFDPGIGVSKRRKLETLTKQLFEMTRQLDGNTDEQANLISIAVSVMGRDALLGTLAFSLYKFLTGVQGQSIGSQRFPPVPIDTGVPYVWRVSLEPDTEDQTFECRLDELLEQDESERLKLFGVGQHTCLGKAHSLKIFQVLSDYLSECELLVASVDVVERSRHVLKLPEELFVELR